MKLTFKKVQGTMLGNPNGVFTSINKVRIRKNAKQITVNELTLWEYDEWVGSIQDYVEYTNSLLNLPSNQLEVFASLENEHHDLVEVVLDEDNNVWIVDMYANEEIQEDGKYLYSKLSFERPKIDDSTAQEIANEYTKYREAMFEFCIYPEAPIKANRTSVIPLLNAIIELKKENNNLTQRIIALEGGN